MNTFPSDSDYYLRMNSEVQKIEFASEDKKMEIHEFKYQFVRKWLTSYLNAPT